MALIRQTRISPGPSANAIFHRGVIPILIAIILTIAIACFQLAHGSPVVLESPADNNSATHGSHNIHFVLCVNGLNAHASDFDNLQTKIRQAHVADPRDLHILVSRVNQKLQTRHGLVVMGTRLAREVHAYVRETLLTDRGRSNDDRMKATRLKVHLTVIGHSLGGLIARYAVRLMLADDGAVVPEYDLLALLRDGLSGSTYDTVEMVPLSYISVSSPHL